MPGQQPRAAAEVVHVRSVAMVRRHARGRVARAQGGRERPHARVRPVHEPERGRAARVRPARELRRLEVPQEEAAAPLDGPEELNPGARDGPGRDAASAS